MLTNLIMVIICLISVQFSSVAQLCLTLCDPMNYSTPSLPVILILAPSSNLPQAFPSMKLVYPQNVPGLNVSAYFPHWGWIFPVKSILHKVLSVWRADPPCTVIWCKGMVMTLITSDAGWRLTILTPWLSRSFLSTATFQNKQEQGYL